MRWRLRRADPADAAALSLVASATFLEAFAGVLLGSDITAHCLMNNAAAKFERWTADPDGAVVVAEHEEGHAPLGYTVLTTPELPVDPGPGDIELKRIYALTATHGAGLGRALMTQALADAAALGKRRILLGVHAGNARARRFYERQGFAVIGERRFRVGDTWHDDLVYARAI